MQLTWENKTADQNLTWSYVDSDGHQRNGPIAAGDTHTEDGSTFGASLMGFFGPFNGYQYVSIPQNAGDNVTATASDMPTEK
jgi:hypothetical protein